MTRGRPIRHGKGPQALRENSQGEKPGNPKDSEGWQSRSLGKRPVESPLLVQCGLFTLLLMHLPYCIYTLMPLLSPVLSEAHHTHKCSFGGSALWKALKHDLCAQMLERR